MCSLFKDDSVSRLASNRRNFSMEFLWKEVVVLLSILLLLWKLMLKNTYTKYWTCIIAFQNTHPSMSLSSKISWHFTSTALKKPNFCNLTSKSVSKAISILLLLFQFQLCHCLQPTSARHPPTEIFRNIHFTSELSRAWFYIPSGFLISQLWENLRK